VKAKECGDIRVCGYKDCARLNEQRRRAYRVLVRKPERAHLQDLGIDGRIIFKWIFKNLMEGWHGLDCSGSGYGQVTDSCQCGNKPSDFHKIPGISSLAKELEALYSIQFALCS
jgi:hypothetical protein